MYMYRLHTESYTWTANMDSEKIFKKSLNLVSSGSRLREQDGVTAVHGAGVRHRHGWPGVGLHAS